MAIEIPLSRAGANAAVVAGAETASPKSAAFHKAEQEWYLEPDGDTPEPVGIYLGLQTPFHVLFSAGADAAAQNADVNPELIKDAIAYRRLSIHALLFSDNVSDNDGARIIVQQAGEMIQPVKNAVTHSAPTQVYWENVDAQFDLAKLNLAKPFSVILTDISSRMKSGADVKEIHYTVDPAKVR